MRNIYLNLTKEELVEFITKLAEKERAIVKDINGLIEYMSEHEVSDEDFEEAVLAIGQSEVLLRKLTINIALMKVALMNKYDIFITTYLKEES